MNKSEQVIPVPAKELLDIYTWDGVSLQWPARKLRQQIISKSRERHIAAFTGDHKGRFQDINHFETWAHQGRVLFAMTNVSLDLAGLIWFLQKGASRHAES